MWIDSHCHLNHERITDLGDPDAIVSGISRSQLSGMMTICCRIHQEAELLRGIADRHDHVWCSVGTHPHDAGLEAEKAYSAEDIAKFVQSHDKTIAIGETGLDYFYENSSRADQKASFIKHLEACVMSDVPVIIHTRDADDDTAQILEDFYKQSGGQLRGVLHCFSSGRVLAERALDIGFYVSFSGIVTFKRSQELRDIVKDIPIDRILVETDAPFLAPQSRRGQVNSPEYVEEVGRMIADIHGLSHEECALITSNNFYQLFTKAKRV